MTSNRYAAFLPYILAWIHQTLDGYAAEKQPVLSFTLSRLPRYFPADILNKASVVVTDEPPRPPRLVRSFRVRGLREPANQRHHILNTYFVTPTAAQDESVHFHELVHVIQWQVLGPEDFLLWYAAGLAEYGYLDSPLERMAYEHQQRFDAGEPLYPVDVEVRIETLALRSTFHGLHIVARGSNVMNRRRHPHANYCFTR